MGLPEYVSVQETIRLFGYDPNNLSHKSHKHIVICCEFCNLYRPIQRRYLDSPCCQKCTGVQRLYLKSGSTESKHIFWLRHRPKLDLTRINIEESKKRFGYKHINISAKVNKPVVATCEFCNNEYETTLISLHSNQSYICCYQCSSIAAQYGKRNNGLNKYEFGESVRLQRLKFKNSATLCSELLPHSDKRITIKCEFCHNIIQKAAKYTYHRSGCIACKKCSKCAVDFITNNDGLDKRTFWLRRQSKIDLFSIDLVATKEKFGYDPTSFSIGCNQKVVVRCCYCQKPTVSSFSYFVKRNCRKSCKDCKHKRNVETLQNKYGVSTVLDIPSVQNKLKDPLTEQIVENFLKNKYRVDYKRNFSIPIHDDKFYIFDFYVPSANLLIECQGDYFHNFKENGYSGTPKDRSKSSFIELHTNFKLVHVLEHEIHLGRISKILGYHIHSAIESKLDVDIKKIEFRKISDSDAHVFLSAYHYLGHLGTASSCYGGFFDGTLICVSTFGGTTRQTSLKKINKLTGSSFNFKQLKELRRFCIKPNVIAKRMASYCIRKFIEVYKRDFPDVLAIISFADPTVGDSGNIYKYAGWSRLQDTGKSYHYLDTKTSRIIHKKTVWDSAKDAHMTEKEFARSADLVMVSEMSKHMWVKIL